MAQYKRPPKQKKKGPDEFISFWDHVVRFFMFHRDKLIGLVIVSLLAFGGYGFWIYYQGNRAKKLATLYETALQAPAPQSIEDWQGFIEQNPPLSLKALAAFELGGRLAAEKKWQQAAEAYQEAAESKNPLLRNIGLWSKAVALENAGELEQALQSFENLAKDPQDAFYLYGLLGKARILSEMGKHEDAKGVLEQILNQSGQEASAIRRAAERQLLVLQLSS